MSHFITALFIIVFLKAISYDAITYELKKCRGGGCPYSATWLLHFNFYKRLKWYLSSTKMEEATFKAFEKPSLKYQLYDENAYYVHHLSEFEHRLHKKHGLAYARNQTLRLTGAAYRGECLTSNLTDPSLRRKHDDDYIAFVPFYGGLPPNVTADFAVRSIGQGNSLVSCST